MNLDDANDTGWAIIKAFCEQQLDMIGEMKPDATTGYSLHKINGRRASIQDVISFVEENAP
jgi:hypothetical protein